MSSFNAEKVIKAAIPDANQQLVDFIVWSRTCYPFGRITPRILYKAASRLKRAENNSIRLCDFCNNKAENEAWLCASCNGALAKNRPTT